MEASKIVLENAKTEEFALTENANAEEDIQAHTASIKVILVAYLSSYFNIDQISSKMLWYFIVFLLIGLVIAGLFIFSYKVWMKMKQQASVDNDSIIGDSSGQPKGASRFKVENNWLIKR